MSVCLYEKESCSCNTRLVPVPRSDSTESTLGCVSRVTSRLPCARICTPFGALLVFCSCSKHHYHHHHHSNSITHMHEPDNLLWEGSRHILHLSVPLHMWNDVMWFRLWHDPVKNCSCGLACISTFTGHHHTQSGWYDVYFDAVKNNEHRTNLRSAFFLSLKSASNFESTLTSVPSSLSSMSHAAQDEKIAVTSTEYAEPAGSAPSCKIMAADLGSLKKEWMLV
uniref:Wsv446-like protein n=1 Tax=Hemigrapsus takanoi nimavirus TaxID=2133792 RepID=A0A401IP46_9VIRU|nr:wsv446-like protein [Hemigrapsus takanoi nimavirus]